MHREKRYGAIGRRRGRLKSVAEALAMLEQLARGKTAGRRAASAPGPPVPVDLIRPRPAPAREAAGERPEQCGHDEGERAALELVGEIELDVAATLGRTERPAVLQPPERAAQIIDEDLHRVAVEGDVGRERLADELVGDRHLADEGRAAALVLSAL